jgi:1,4-alpha-glucan branching enzyme
VSEGLELVEPAVGAAIEPSSWGTGKDLSTWDAAAVSDFPFTARAAELRAVRIAATHAEPRTALARAARELLALQSSDWAFMASRALAADYPQRRLEGHSRALDAALAALADSAPSPGAHLRNLAPHLDLASLTTP